MTIAERISKVKKELEVNASKLQQLAQMQDQLIAENNMLIGKLKAFEELNQESNITEDKTDD